MSSIYRRALVFKDSLNIEDMAILNKVGDLDKPNTNLE